MILGFLMSVKVEGCVIRRAGAGDFALIRGHSAITWNAHATNRPDMFRPMEEEDFPLTHFEIYLKDRDILMLVAEWEGVAAGSLFASVSQSDEDLGLRACRAVFIHNVVTDPAMRGRGVARALIGAAAEWATELKAARVDLEVWSFNESAIAVYRKLGFATTFSELTIPTSELVARLGAGRLPKMPPPPPSPPSPPSWLARFLRRH